MHSGQAIDGDVLTALQSGFKRYLYESQSLDEAFYLKQTRIRADYLKNERDTYLKLACRNIAYTSPSDLAKKLEKELNQFEALLWPKFKNLNEPPMGTSYLRWRLFQAFKTGLKMPEYRQLYRILWDDK